MAIIVEYLLMVKKADTFCETGEAFTSLLNLNSLISINGSTATYKTTGFKCEYAITSGEIKGKEQRYFQVKFSLEECATQEQYDQFSAFLRVVRTDMSKLGGQPETLWDDISFHYSKNAYSLIYRVENLMRKLIANFMLVTVGSGWIKESAPSEIKDVIRKSKRKQEEFLNVLHSIDFIHLADFLLRPYSTSTAEEIYKRIQAAKTMEDIDEVRTCIPQSNWTRYFSKLVVCDESHLKKCWETLYDLRCKVAHNAIVDKGDFEQIETLVRELEGELEDAIKKLPQVSVPVSEIEQVAENAASNISSSMGNFISAWRLLEERLLKAAKRYGQKFPLVRNSIDLLHKNAVLNAEQHDRLRRLSVIRNRIVHPTGVSVTQNELEKAIREIRALNELIGGSDENTEHPSDPSN